MAIPGIHEIQTLATKYSKAQLQKMAQMGLIDSTKAVMAGMMIDRISKQNMAAPATTVAEDALAPPVPQGSPQGPPQMGSGGAPPQASAGIAALPSNIPEMAGGGIVAFDDGGEVQGYKDEGFVISKEKQRLRDVDRFQILADELREEQSLAASKTGIDRLRHEKNIEALQREMRTIKAAPSAANIPIPAAAAAVPMTAPAQTKPSAPVAQDTGDYYQDPLGAPDYTTEGFNFKKRVEPGKPYEPSIQGQIFGYERGTLPPINAPKKTDIVVPPAPEVFQPRAEAAPPVEQVVPRERRERGAPEDLGKITAEQITVPETTTLAAERERREAAYSEAGVDTNMYKEMMAEVASRKEGGAKKREQALGMALMMTGLGLAGARRGQEFQTLSGAGRQALAQFQGTMDNIVANEDKLDNMVRELKMAENNYKKTGAESDLARVRAREDKIEAINIKNMELKNAANLESKKLAVTAYGYRDKPGPVVELVDRILDDMRATNPKATFQDALKFYNQSGGKSGEISKTTAFKEYNDLIAADITGKQKQLYPNFESYWAAIPKDTSTPKGSLAPGKDGTFNYVPGGTK
jgi:hypothetical protein